MKLAIFCLAVFAFGMSGCSNAAAPVQTNSNSSASANANEHPQTMIAHSTENQPPPGGNGAPATRTKWTQSGDPIDTKEYDAAISKAEKGGKPTDNKALSEAYFNRAVALTHARQYASALGDYRRAVKLDPDNTEAKQWIDQILGIYDSMNKEAPKEGEEPPPLPYKK
jgi:tetratricopeptide (TPR) repeat protein